MFSDEKALQFIQAEKLYYEKALIDLGDLLTNSDGSPSMSNGHAHTDAVRMPSGQVEDIDYSISCVCCWTGCS